MSEIYTITKPTQEPDLFEPSTNTSFKGQESLDLSLISILPNGRVDGRGLHMFLQIKTKFADWISRNIEFGCFVENLDFLKIGKPHENNIIDYHLSINMALELCMTARNEQGKKARKFLAEIQKRSLVTPKPAIQPVNQLDYLQLLLDQLKEQHSQISAVQTQVKSLQENQLQLESISINCPVQTDRQRLVELVSKIGDQFGIVYGVVWQKLYTMLRHSQVLDGHGVHLNTRIQAIKRQTGVELKPIELIEQLGLCQASYSLLVNHYKVRPSIDFYQD